MTIAFMPLGADQNWIDLGKDVCGTDPVDPAKSLLDALRARGAVYAIAERDYIDRDFSAEFSSFYSTLFRKFSKYCTRYHFFSRNLDGLRGVPPLEFINELEAASRAKQYLGFIVSRPLLHAPVAKAVIGGVAQLPGSVSKQLVRSDFEVHFAGATLKVEGLPFSQQDNRIATCAQTSIWMSTRHFHSKHGGPWVSTVDINEAATKPMDSVVSQGLPAGSRGLSIDNMVRALRAVGREPFVYMGTYDTTTKKAKWPSTLDPIAIIDRYIDSGIPVIVGLGSWDSQEVGHAVVVGGHTLMTRPSDFVFPAKPTRAAFADYFLIHDDQRGSSLRLSIDTARSKQGQTPYSLSNAFYILVPLPGKVFVQGEVTEALSRNALKNYVDNWPTISQTLAPKDKSSIALGNELVAWHKADQVVARTYLTYGWKYKRRLLKNTCSETLKAKVRWLDLPRYVWVTEFGSINAFNNLDDGAVRIVSHVVNDATSHWDGMCVFHAPGIGVTRQPGSSGSWPKMNATQFQIHDDVAYGIKVRGVA